MHHPLIHGPLYCIHKEGPNSADSETAEEDLQALGSISLLRNLQSA